MLDAEKNNIFFIIIIIKTITSFIKNTKIVPESLYWIFYKSIWHPYMTLRRHVLTVELSPRK